MLCNVFDLHRLQAGRFAIEICTVSCLLGFTHYPRIVERESKLSIMPSLNAEHRKING